MNQIDYINQLNTEGYSTVLKVYSDSEVDKICALILDKNADDQSVHKSKDLYGIRELLIDKPDLTSLIFNTRLRSLITKLQTDKELFLCKAIYFDKPKHSNWLVPYHQDLTINVTKKADVEGFKNWTNKRGQIGVQPPIEYLKRIITLRIHLDDTDETNGALRVVPKSHNKGIIRLTEHNKPNYEISCNVQRGGLMLMKPLILHASSRSTGNRNRRVIHIELCDLELPEALNWKERTEIKNLNYSSN